MNRQKRFKVLQKACFILLIAAILAETVIGHSPIQAYAGTEDENTIVSFSKDAAIKAASQDKSLPADPTQSAQVEALGLPTEQPARTTPAGEEVDKSANPMGPNTTFMNRNYQLAFNYTLNGQDRLSVYDDLGGPSLIQLNASGVFGNHSLTSNTPSASASFENTIHKQVVAVDIDGNGTQEVATVGYVLGTTSRYELQLYITDYNDIKKNSSGTKPSSSDIYTIATTNTYPNQDLSYANDALKCTSGDFDHDNIDEIAIATGKRIYICKATMTTFNLVASKKFDRPIGDIEALDSNGDGFPELLATMDSDGRSIPASLMIFNGTDVSAPAFTIPLERRSTKFINATVDIGDLLGDGDNTLVIGGLSTLGAAISYIKYYPETKTYDTSLTKVYHLSLGSTTNFNAVQNDYQVKCVSLATTVPGTPEYVTMGGYIFMYDFSRDVLERQTLFSASTDSPGVDINNANKSGSNITNVNLIPDSSYNFLYGEDETYITQTLVGNFDENKEGREQIILVHYNKCYNKEIVYVTKCYMDKLTGALYSNLHEIWRKTPTNRYIYPSVCPVDVHNHSTRMEFLPDRSSFVYSNPIITAVLGASPYYEELEDEYITLSAAATTYGSGNQEESSTSNGVTANIGVSVGYEQGVGIFGVTLFKVEFEAEVTNSFSWAWSSATSISKDISYANYYDQDAVVVAVIPYDVYVYNVSVWNETSGQYETGEVVVQIPCSPLTTMMSVESYNMAATSIPNAPSVSPDIFGPGRTVGDPRSYPISSRELSNVEGTDVLMTGTNDDSSFTGTGFGNSSSTQSITLSNTNGKSFDYELNVNVGFNVNVGGFTAGVSGGAGYTRNVTISSTESTTRAGSVGAVPDEYQDYQFRWALVAYNYNLEAGDSTQETIVISYMCRPISNNYPPKIPENLSVDSQDLNLNSLRWDPADGASAYHVLRSDSEDGTYEAIATLSGMNTNVYTDSTIERNKDYYYKIRSFSGNIFAKPSNPLTVEFLYVTELQIITQPKLTYDENDALDLADLTVNLVFSNNIEELVTYTDFEQYEITTSLENGIELEYGNTGTPITVRYVPNDVSNNTNNLTVNANSPYPISLTVNYSVGSTANATALAAGERLHAAINMENTQSTAKRVIAILTLYNEEGTMVECETQSSLIRANSSKNVVIRLMLPSNINGYKAKVFVWDGPNLSSSNLSPLSEVVQIPAY